MFTLNNNPKKETKLKGDEFVPPPTNTYTEYNPLKDLPRFYAGQKLTYKIPTNQETLFEEDANPHRRTFTDYLTFYTGTSWVCGSLLGGAKGTVEGIKAAERGDSLKIRVNRVLNSTGSVGRRVANRGAVVGLLFSCIDGGIKYLGDGRIKYIGNVVIEDDLRVVLAGVGTGALCRVFGGVRGAAVGGAVGGVLAGAFLGGRELVNRFGPDLRAKFDKF